MSILAAALYGSQARGDGAASSDTDILVVTDEDGIRVETLRNISLSYYPGPVLRKLAADGDLFVGHIVLEAKTLFDTVELFDELRASWRTKSDYSQEIDHASTLAGFLLSKHASRLDAALVNKRIAWCVRTVLVARSFEAGSPAFATPSLANFANLPNVTDLIELKSSACRHPEMADALRHVLRKWGHYHSGLETGSDIKTYRQAFVEAGNRVGLQTISIGLGKNRGDYLFTSECCLKTFSRWEKGWEDLKEIEKNSVNSIVCLNNGRPGRTPQLATVVRSRQPR